MNRSVFLIAALLLCASVLPAPARAIPPGLYDIKWQGLFDVNIYNTTGDPSILPGNTLLNTTSPGQPIGFENVTVCPADPDGVQLFAGPVTPPSTAQVFAYGYSGTTFLVADVVQTNLISILPLTGLIDTDGGRLVDVRTEVDLLLDGSEDGLTTVFEGSPGPAGSVLMFLAHKPDPDMNGLDDDEVPRNRQSAYFSTGTATSVMTLDPFPSNIVIGSGAALDPLCDPTANPSTCSATLVQQPTTACGTQGPNMPNDECAAVEVTNIIGRFALDVVFTRTGDLPPEADCNDTDGDGILDLADNCVNVANGPLAAVSHGSPSQVDADEDQIGNACDCDFDQDPTATCGFSDFNILLDHFGEFCPQVTACEKAPAEIRECDTVDMDRNDTVGFNDFTLFLDGFGGAAGPSGLPGGPAVADPPPSRNCS